MENEQNRTFFDGWKIVRKIDSGASGTVYEIRKTNHDIVMTSAMKVIQIPKDPSVASALSSDGLDEVSITGYFQGIVDELVDEIRLMISLKGFPQIVSCEDYEVQKAPDALSWTILIRMELLTSLPQYLEEKRLTEADICRMGTDLAQALALLEDRAIIHRDIKPANIFLSAYGTCKLGDFGIARVYDKAAGNLSKKGTINYMAPEVYRGMSYDQTVDIYSLGLVLYKLSNQNRLPFYPPGDSYTAMDEQQALMDRMNGEKELPLPVSVSAEFGEIIRKMCAFRAEERYRNAVELLEDLGRLQPTGQVVLTQKKPETEAFEEKASKTQDRELTDGLFKEKPRIQVTENSIEKEYPIPDLIPPEKKQEKEEKQNSLWEEDSAPVTSTETEKKKKFRKRIPEVLVVVFILAAAGISWLMSRQYSLTVVGGSGGGSYKAGMMVTVSALSESGKVFTGWESEGLELTAGERDSEKLEFKMPRKSITLTAGYDTAYYTVSVLSGTGSGDYALGDEVTVEAENPDAGYEFIGWKVSRGKISLSDRQSMKVLFEMPEENVELEAQYQPIEYQLNVQNGFGGGSYHLGDTVSISADPLKDGMIFSYWSVDAGTLEFSDASAANLTFRMPAEDLVITAHYSVKKYTLKVENGRGSGMYSPQDTVTITADTPKDSQTVFHSWSIVSGTFKGEEPDLIQQELTFHMPENDLVLQANYMTVQTPEKEPAQTEKYTLTVNGGTGSGTYTAGEQIRITHDAPAEGMSFTGWIVFWNQESKEMDSDTLTLTMPECDVIVTAVFS